MEFLLLRRVLWRALSREPELLEGSDPFVVQSRLDGAVDVLVVEFAVAFFDRATQALAEQARADPLTRLLNHQAFWGEVGTELERAARYGHELTLVYVDVDDFKGINDRYGHPAGDRVLRAVAAWSCSTRHATRTSSAAPVATSSPRASSRASRTPAPASSPACVAACRAQPRSRHAAVAVITAGAARFPAEAGNPDALFELADARLYDAKRSR